MQSIRTLPILLVSFMLSAGYASAEFRLWTDVKGNSIEAECVRVAENKVVLRKRDGSEIKISLESLCEEDRHRAILQSPPEIEINVDDRVDRETLGYTGGRAGLSKVEIESVTVDVSLRKTSPEIYDAELSLEVALISRLEQLDRYVIIERSSSTFRFAGENKGGYSHAFGPVDLRKVSGKRRAGSEYEGYLLVVRDARDEIIATKSNRLEFEKNASAILNEGKGAVFDQDFNCIDAKKQRAPRVRRDRNRL